MMRLSMNNWYDNVFLAPPEPTDEDEFIEDWLQKHSSLEELIKFPWIDKYIDWNALDELLYEEAKKAYREAVIQAKEPE